MFAYFAFESSEDADVGCFQKREANLKALAEIYKETTLLESSELIPEPNSGFGLQISSASQRHHNFALQSVADWKHPCFSHVHSRFGMNLDNILLDWDKFGGQKSMIV